MLCLSGQLYLYPICKSWWMQKGDQAAFGAEECWDYPDSTIPRLNIQTVSWQELAPLRTDKISYKGSLDKPTSYSNDNLPKAAELKAAELQCAVLGVDTLTDCDFTQEKSRKVRFTSGSLNKLVEFSTSVSLSLETTLIMTLTSPRGQVGRNNSCPSNIPTMLKKNAWLLLELSGEQMLKSKQEAPCLYQM